VDTYDVVEGVNNAIRVAQEMRAVGKTLRGIRIDSGDLAYYSKVARSMLDEAGFLVRFASSDPMSGHRKPQRPGAH
jgi:nicotinate phosphoribosyltransferase